MAKALWWAVLACAVLAPCAHAEDGITKDTILIGRSAGMTGAIAARMKPATEAISAYFNMVNAAGGINGRQLKLINVDDGNDPKRSVANVRKLVTEEKVFTLFSQSGTPQTQAVVPLLTELQVPLIGTTSGANSLRAPNKYLFHSKASYGDELVKIGEHIKTTGINRVAIVYSDDGAGREGNQLAIAGLEKQGLKPALSFAFKPGAAKAAADALEKANVQAVILTSLAAPGAEFFKEFVKLPSRPQIFTWSIMVVEQIYKDVGDKAYGLVVSQIAPSPADRTAGVVRDYQDLLKKARLEDGGYSGLEAFISARILVEGLKRTGKTPTRAGLMSALESMHDFDLGNDMVDFRADHVGRRFVELTIVGRDGRFLR
ncbi:MAG TPA: ABC transporter substrate-binding protein [Burkholderiales bacterium]|jgi:ABC-type branched-subunit amino acid transport system substrate-binding protein